MNWEGFENSILSIVCQRWAALEKRRRKMVRFQESSRIASDSSKTGESDHAAQSIFQYSCHSMKESKLIFEGVKGRVAKKSMQQHCRM